MSSSSLVVARNNSSLIRRIGNRDRKRIASNSSLLHARLMLRKNDPYAVEQAFPKKHKAAVLEDHEMQLLADSLEPTVATAVVPSIPPLPSSSLGASPIVLDSDVTVPSPPAASMTVQPPAVAAQNSSMPSVPAAPVPAVQSAVAAPAVFASIPTVESLQQAQQEEQVHVFPIAPHENNVAALPGVPAAPIPAVPPIASDPAVFVPTSIAANQAQQEPQVEVFPIAEHESFADLSALPYDEEEAFVMANGDEEDEEIYEESNGTPGRLSQFFSIWKAFVCIGLVVVCCSALGLHFSSYTTAPGSTPTVPIPSTAARSATFMDAAVDMDTGSIAVSPEPIESAPFVSITALAVRLLPLKMIVSSVVSQIFTTGMKFIMLCQEFLVRLLSVALAYFLVSFARRFNTFGLVWWLMVATMASMRRGYASTCFVLSLCAGWINDRFRFLSLTLQQWNESRRQLWAAVGPFRQDQQANPRPPAYRNGSRAEWFLFLAVAQVVVGFVGLGLVAAGKFPGVPLNDDTEELVRLWGCIVNAMNFSSSPSPLSGNTTTLHSEFGLFGDCAAELDMGILRVAGLGLVMFMGFAYCSMSVFCDMTDVEKHCIYLYSTDQGYDRMNRALRGNDYIGFGLRWRIWLVESGLSKLPLFRGTVRRRSA